jgi:hypothetical protein
MRALICLSLVSLLLANVGCCGPMGCGPGCAALDGGCQDCEGGFGPAMACGPLDALRQARRSLVCGGGCGEVYYGEWISTPPYAQDPCCGDQFSGGGVRCAPFCRVPGTLLYGLTAGLYGKRFSGDCGMESDCGCGGEWTDGGCDSCGASMATDEGGWIGESHSAPAPTGGCASCGTTALRAPARINQQVQHQRMGSAPAQQRQASRPVMIQDGRTMR